MRQGGHPNLLASERRAQARQSDPALRVRFSATDHVTTDWSFGGMLLTDYAGPLGAGALLTITAMALGDEPLSIVRVKARVVRADPASRQLALTFLDVDETAYALLGRRYLP